jgi:hypothetical protein
MDKGLLHVLKTVPDSGYMWVLYYQDHFTKFSILRPLKSKTAAKVAYNLLAIFLILGAPMILQSDNGHEFTANITTELMSLWPDLKIVHFMVDHVTHRARIPWKGRMLM